MWRLFRPRASAAATRALTPKVSGRETITIQRVKISKARFRPRSILIGTGISLMCLHVYWSTVLNPFFRHVDREYESLSAAEKKALDEEMEEETEPWFIPFPFTTKQVSQPPYKGSDPEWQQYVKISKNKELQNHIRGDLANWVRSAVERHPTIIARCGNVVNLRRYWLDIDFPYRPPPVYYSSGLLMEDDGLYWSTQPVDSLTVNRLNKILWPEAMTVSTWAFTSALMKQHFMDITRALGFEPSKPAQPFPPPNGGNMQRAKTERPLPSTNRQTTDGTPAENASHNVSKTSDSRQPEEPESGGRTNFVRDTAISHIEGMKQITDGPAREFRRKLAQSWKPTRAYPPRGCILVSGFVEIELPRGYVVVDVWGHWNPKTEMFEPRSTFMVLRRIQMKQQAPARS
ncbi:hypothetical protein CkaCkLH20_10063 [Colletotrichum karsti]|uniref:Uncharacterized protein n=1 Tax=Colletotrichum karsti TaxID=1095194 RepID=A0A9P6LGU8_9PEZI|nr:uncharacterized protein CkaCkLH20_10063 [Colletotrichum karsti]KAF9872566.1 hypothetical protein CkaCkLH20_10063 [Colletotrichum karsti]